jgi:transposase
VLKKSTQWTAQQAAFMATLSKSHLKTARAWRIKETVRDIVRDKADAATTETALRRLAGWAQRSQLEPMIRFGKTVRKHMDGIVRAISERRSNAFAEGLNSAIQAAKQRARGFKTANNFIAVIYLIAGKLKHLPTTPMHTRGSTTPAFA